MSLILSTLAYVVMGIYLFSLMVITVYCLLQLDLLFKYRMRPHRSAISDLEERPAWPRVTVQLPIYNERYVTARLIDQIMRLDYPRDRWEVQVLDDSTDETSGIAAERVRYYTDRGFTIHHVQRADRAGFKAGALAHGLERAAGRFIAIFDADFLPKPDFLRATMPYMLRDDQLGVVQTRWGHINEEYSILTRVQAFQLNVHFTVEQAGRDRGDCLLQFNGTAGLWRKKAIEESGGWQADTLTEDLDLSYRAQLGGWKIRYLQDIESPAELPSELYGLRSQQYRWMKGGAETARKMLPEVWRSQLPFAQKLHASGHLLGSTVFIFVFLVGVFSLPAMLIAVNWQLQDWFFGIFIVGLLAILAVYWEANVLQSHTDRSYWKRGLYFIGLFPIFLALSMGLSLHNAAAVIHGYLGRKSAFIRTPKFAIRSETDDFKTKRDYHRVALSPLMIAEACLALYFIFSIYLGIQLEETRFLIFHGMLVFGFGAMFYYGVRHAS